MSEIPLPPFDFSETIHTQNMYSKIPNLYIYFGHGITFCEDGGFIKKTVPPNTTVVTLTTHGNVGISNIDDENRILLSPQYVPVLINPSNTNALQKMFSKIYGNNYVPHVNNPGDSYIVGYYQPVSLFPSKTPGYITLSISGIHHRNSCFKNIDGSMNKKRIEFINDIRGNYYKDEYALPIKTSEFLEKFTCSIKPTIFEVSDKIRELFGNVDTLDYEQLEELSNALSFYIEDFIDDHPGIHYLTLCRTVSVINDPYNMCNKRTLIQRTQSAITHNSLIPDLLNMIISYNQNPDRDITEKDILLYLKDIYDRIEYKDVFMDKRHYTAMYSRILTLARKTSKLDYTVSFLTQLANYIKLKENVRIKQYYFERNPSSTKLLHELNFIKKEFYNYSKSFKEKEIKYIDSLGGKRKTIRRRKHRNKTKRRY